MDSTTQDKTPAQTTQICLKSTEYRTLYYRRLDWSKNNLLTVKLHNAANVHNMVPPGKILTLKNLKKNSTMLTCIKNHPELSCVAISNNKGSIMVWDVSTEKLRRTFYRYDQLPICHVNWLGDNVMSASPNSELLLHDLRDPNEVVSTFATKSTILRIDHTQDGSHFATCSYNGGVNVFDSRSYVPIQKHKRNLTLSCLKFCPWNSDILALGGMLYSNPIILYDWKRNIVLSGVPKTPSQIFTLNWSHNRKQLVVSCGQPDPGLIFIDVNLSGKALMNVRHKMSLDNDLVLDMVIDPAEENFATCGRYSMRVMKYPIMKESGSCTGDNPVETKT